MFVIWDHFVLKFVKDGRKKIPGRQNKSLCKKAIHIYLLYNWTYTSLRYRLYLKEKDHQRDEMNEAPVIKKSS